MRDIAFADVMAERLGIPVVVDNDANCHTVCESRLGIAQGATEVTLLTLGTGIGGGLLLRGEIYRGWINGGAEMGHMVVEINGRPCQGNCPNWGCLESVASGSALVREASLAVARRPDTELGRALEEGRELTGPLITELANAGDPVARGAMTIGRALGVGITNLVNIFNPQVVVIGGGVIAAGEVLLAPAREVMLERALAPAKDAVRVEAARFGPKRGDDRGRPARSRPAQWRRHGRDRSASSDGMTEPMGSSPEPSGPARARGADGRLVVCPTPIGNLEDITLRVLAALREADVVACEDTRHTRVLLERYGVSATLVSYHEHNERARAAELVERMQCGRGRRAGQRCGNSPWADAASAASAASCAFACTSLSGRWRQT